MLNKVILIGRLGADPELKRTQSERSVTSFSLAVERDFAPKGEKRETDWVECVAWGTTAEFICKWFGKGRQMAVTGRLQVRPWEDKQGNKRRSTEVVVDNAYFADSKQEDKGSGGRSTAQSQTLGPGAQSNNDLPFTFGAEDDAYGDYDIDDVELPY